ncbi:hypothetical protein FraQA3DRAFT_5347 [Frankia sp. QA3]|nr:hypothetical protein FraQA3DRAFT_5347 [Frankia sp. QA3]
MLPSWSIRMSGNSRRRLGDLTAGPGRHRTRHATAAGCRRRQRYVAEPSGASASAGCPRSAGDDGAVHRATSSGGGDPRKLPARFGPVTGTTDDQRGLARRSGWSRAQVRCTELRGPSHPGQPRNYRGDRLVTLAANLSGREGWDNTDSPRDDRPLATPGEGRRRAASGASPLHYAWGPRRVPVRGRPAGLPGAAWTRSGGMARGAFGASPVGSPVTAPVGYPVAPAVSGRVVGSVAGARPSAQFRRVPSGG